MNDEKPKVIFLDSDNSERLPFPTFVTYRDPPTEDQARWRVRRYEADKVFGYYKLDLSEEDKEKMDKYLDGEISTDELIQRFKDAN